MMHNHVHNCLDSYVGGKSSLICSNYMTYSSGIVRVFLEYVFVQISSKHIRRKMIQNSCMILIISISVSLLGQRIQNTFMVFTNILLSPFTISYRAICTSHCFIFRQHFLLIPPAGIPQIKIFTITFFNNYNFLIKDFQVKNHNHPQTI